MADIHIMLVVHHSGTINGNMYIGSSHKVVEDLFDVDLLSYPNIMSYIKEMGYSKVNGVYYKCVQSRNLIQLIDDRSVMQITPLLKNGDTLDLYIDHYKGVED